VTVRKKQELHPALKANVERMKNHGKSKTQVPAKKKLRKRSK